MNGLGDAMARWWAGGDLLMWPMLAAALLLYALIVERAWVLFGPGSRRRRRADELETLVEVDHRPIRPEPAVPSSAGPTGGLPLQGAAARDPAGGEAAVGYRRWIATYVALAEEGELTRGFLAIRALTLALPLLGLLGTVTGMVDTFAALAQARGGNPVQHASAGIGLALTATQYGMALAVPAVLLEAVLRRRVDALIAHRERVASRLIAAGDDGGRAAAPVAGVAGVPAAQRVQA